ncbi:TPA: hypothetical protein L6A42_03770 [Pseudomonas aeruginosa]|nr:hypothetical protein DY971_23975 [Pseudomonas aeruginosa]TEQ77325.1 hypothetical protein IPC51_00885 [Pseudomonas aeruginosa]TEQ78247.1 hypothetical protein IPC50_03925 [Pseudomonas aeruginosa]HBP4622255.1 hypothetical protein [Pseudomonas aeruginosa]HBP6570044.1 hypothetical protein [Pseudomonas aeruginosa]
MESGASVVAFCFHTKKPSEARKMKIDRSVQRAVLDRLADAYPRQVDFDDLADLFDENEDMTWCCKYLHEHGLVRASITGHMNGPQEVLHVGITAKGLDFLEDDGGLSAILGVVTIKLHEDLIRQLVESRLLQAELPDAEKQGMLQALKQAPADSIKHLTTRLLDAGLENLPRAVQIVQTWIQSGPA